MRLVGTTSRKEVTITLGIWLVLLIGAIVGLLVLRSQATDIITRIYYVNVSSGQKAEVLYAEAEKNARALLKKYDAHTQEGAQPKPAAATHIPPDDPQLKRCLTLFEEAMTVDGRPQFSPERTFYYELLGQVYEAAQNKPAELLARANALMSQGNTTDTLEYIARAQNAAPKSPEPLVLLAQVRLKQQDTAAAADAIHKIYESMTPTPDARWVQAELLTAEGKTSGAVAELEKAVAERPHDLRYRIDLGNAFERAGNLGNAIKVMAAGLGHGGWYDAHYLHVYGIYLMNTKDYAEAIRVLDQADQLAPYSGDIQLSLARAYNKAGKPRQAASALKRAAEIKPELQTQILD